MSAPWKPGPIRVANNHAPSTFIPAPTNPRRQINISSAPSAQSLPNSSSINNGPSPPAGGYMSNMYSNSPTSLGYLAFSPPNFNNLEVIYSPTGRGRRETGIIEKLLQNFGFVQCCDRQARLFFHFSQYQGSIDELKNGDEVEFEAGIDKRTSKPIALNITKLTSLNASISEIVSDTRVFGEITYAPKHNCIIKPGSSPQTELGRLSYENKGEWYFLSFTPQDVKGDLRQLKQGDRVSFLVSTDSRNGSIKAREVRLEQSFQAPKYQGVVCSMKENFGFIERADCVKEIFFHFSEYEGDISILAVGDDVEFMIHTRNGKEVATEIVLLPPGTVQFEEVRPETRSGIITQPICRAPGRKPNPDDPLPGRVKYKDQTGSDVEIVFGDRDQSGEYTLLNGDSVTFNLAIDKRDALKRATNVMLMEESLRTSGEKREKGSVATLKDGFGFIKSHDRDLRLFFHFSEILDQKAHIKLNDEVEFSIISADTPDKQNAVRIKILSLANRKRTTSSSVTKSSKSVIQISSPTIEPAVKYKGWIASIKDGYGFLESENHDREIFFHISALNDSSLEVGRDVEYTLKKNNKNTAENITALDIGSIEPLEISDEIVKGEVLRPLRCANPSQDLYQGLIKLDRDIDPKEICFGITGLINKFDFLQIGDNVELKIATVANTNEKRAHHIKPLRKRITSRVRSVKGEHIGIEINSEFEKFGFIDLADGGENKQLFFHQSEVTEGVRLKPADEVEFEIIKNQKTGKVSACQVTRISTSTNIAEKSSNRLSHRVRTVSLSQNENRVSVTREPTIPDNTRGFTLQRTLEDNVKTETNPLSEVIRGIVTCNIENENGQGDSSRCDDNKLGISISAAGDL